MKATVVDKPGTGAPGEADGGGKLGGRRKEEGGRKDRRRRGRLAELRDGGKPSPCSLIVGEVWR